MSPPASRHTGRCCRPGLLQTPLSPLPGSGTVGAGTEGFALHESLICAWRFPALSDAREFLPQHGTRENSPGRLVVLRVLAALRRAGVQLRGERGGVQASVEPQGHLLEGSYGAVSTWGAVYTGYPHLWELQRTRNSQKCALAAGRPRKGGETHPGPRRRLDGASDGKHLPPAGGWLSPVRCRQERSGSAQSLLLLEDGGLPALSSCAGPRAQDSLSCWEDAAVITGPPSQPPLTLLTPQRPVPTCHPTRAATSFVPPVQTGKGTLPGRASPRT